MSDQPPRPAPTAEDLCHFDQNRGRSRTIKKSFDDQAGHPSLEDCRRALAQIRGWKDVLFGLCMVCVIALLDGAICYCLGGRP